MTKSKVHSDKKKICPDCKEKIGFVKGIGEYCGCGPEKCFADWNNNPKQVEAVCLNGGKLRTYCDGKENCVAKDSCKTPSYKEIKELLCKKTKGQQTKLKK